MRATTILILINVAVYVWMVLTIGSNSGSWMTLGGGFSTQALVDHGALVGALVLQGQWWRIVTGAFMHGGVPHIALNMFALYQVGSFVEAVGGTPRFLAVYFVSMLGSGLAVTFFSPDEVTVGASGAIFGLFGALVIIGLRLGKRGRSLIAQSVPIIGLNLVFTFAVPNISAAGHVGGLISGFAIAALLYLVPPRRTASTEVEPLADDVAGEASEPAPEG